MALLLLLELLAGALRTDLEDVLLLTVLLEVLTGALRTVLDEELLLAVLRVVLCAGLATDLWVLFVVLRTVREFRVAGFLTVVLRFTVVDLGVLFTVCLFVTVL